MQLKKIWHSSIRKNALFAQKYLLSHSSITKKLTMQTREEDAEPNNRLLLRKPCAAPSVSLEIGDCEGVETQERLTDDF